MKYHSDTIYGTSRHSHPLCHQTGPDPSSPAEGTLKPTWTSYSTDSHNMSDPALATLVVVPEKPYKFAIGSAAVARGPDGIRSGATSAEAPGGRQFGPGAGRS